MLHIILGILKIIGIILASIIGLLIILFVLGLFYPISYVLEGRKNGVELTAKGKGYWLFHAVSFIIWYEEKTLQYKLRVFGIPISLEPKGKKDKSNRKQNRDSKKNRENKRNEKNRSSEENGNSKEHIDSIDIKDKQGIKDYKNIEIENKYTGTTDNSIEEEVASTPTEQMEDKPEQEGVRICETQKEEKKKSVFGRMKLFWIRIKEFFSKVFSRVRKIKDTLKDLCDKMESIKGQASNIVAILKEEDTKIALKLVKDQLVVLVKHMRPRKIKGYIHFGLEDPAATGYITGVLGMIYPMLPKKFVIRPDFENEVLEGDIYMKGRIQSFVILRIAWILYKDKHIKQIIAKLKK